MSSVLFGLQIAAFVMVIYWAYANEMGGPEKAESGLLAMISAKLAAATAAVGPVPKWRRAPTPAGNGQGATRRTRAPGAGRPRWKRAADDGRR